MQAFEAAARLESFAAAAGELHLSPATVSQRIRTLETHLGVRLFDRLARSVELTELGRAYLPAVRDSFEELAVATSGLFGAVRREQLTVRTQVSYATTWLAPRIHEFQQVHPAIDLRLVCAIWSEALPPGEVDVDIHQGRGPWPGVSSELLHHDHAVVVHGPAHLARYGPVTSHADLAARPRVQVLGFDDVWQRILPGDAVEPERAITVDTSLAALEMAAADDVCAVVPERFARTAVRTGRVSLALDRTWPMRQAHYLLRPLDAPHHTASARAFLRWLDELEQDSAPLGEMTE
ncbi:LysR family glycine cleavage system transcriptional activator [Prauserella sediminis]|uniref:LysR family glycine cleavage system transcriptional activator n=1 Tax=Prauserella sediminis TaxID=577680 RepID=A0A839Y0A8_9PSEU|nr:LysR substrate-binding domain-containing protein [Prauserella sediminis]MBB3666083.1 LysR family glycine cleavage system transcriptional activator [Prauserella sediminis]